jgi:Uri superfamily endonuclease
LIDLVSEVERYTMEIVPGVYKLRIRLKRPRTICVGALGSFRFSAGWYVYTGSARNGLVQRVGRHLRHNKRKHWHIDYLLAVADEAEAFVLPGEKVTECELNAQLRGGKVLIASFGASDCRCEAHLAWLGKKPRIRLTPWRWFIQDCLPY